MSERSAFHFRRCTFIVAGDPAQLTGGYVYDARIVDGLRARGWSVEVIGLAGRFPAPDAVAREAFADALAALPAGTRVVIDGLVMGGLPEVVGAHCRRLRMVALLHHLLGDEHGVDAAQRAAFLRSEAAALVQVGRIIATSAYTARRLADFVPRPIPIDVVEPGVDAAPLA
ncbi:MAG: glycosyl transferase family 1, partial [Betaproteobacteria bacterium HGW-Betaproteobacteria-21]